MAKVWRLGGLTVAAALGVYLLCTALWAQPTDAQPAVDRAPRTDGAFPDRPPTPDNYTKLIDRPEGPQRLPVFVARGVRIVSGSMCVVRPSTNTRARTHAERRTQRTSTRRTLTRIAHTQPRPRDLSLRLRPSRQLLHSGEGRVARPLQAGELEGRAPAALGRHREPFGQD